ncbi:sialate O-acetylesterase [Piscinibacter sp. HJYY11]|uniref:sialate O-acetylesterase n=1 Tax=Piscinibacter sp. HJYY11 TaxID=2801333 RepID=UPI00191D1953|nr:sialate O-acetylesterase [Piscinibacter sp. HJYY11]MBL0727225.1 hypothetical protein [Piscinibacter sp. HJYY11]
MIRCLLAMWESSIARPLSKCLAGLVLATIAPVAAAADNTAGYDIFLLAGQSNMAGRGLVTAPIDADGTPDPAIRMWSHDTQSIVEAKDPLLHPERGSKPTGVGPGMSFAKAYLAWRRANGFPNRKVLLVGAAWGGTSFVQQRSGSNGLRWLVTDNPALGGDLYRGAVARATAAIAEARRLDTTSAIRGILWHQGESDIVNGGAAEYAQRHDELMRAFRSEIPGAAEVPIVVGEMTPCFLWEPCRDSSITVVGQAERTPVLSYLHGIAATLPRSAWVSSAGLSDNGAGDRVHFNTASQRELGRRFFSRFWEAEQALPSPAVHLKVYAGDFFNVGDSIDLDPNFPDRRRNGNLQVLGTVTPEFDAQRGNVARVVRSGGKLSSLVDGTLFNNSYTKMAWVKLASNTYRNHLISANNPAQSHYLYSVGTTKQLTAGHSTAAGTVQAHAQAPQALPVGQWVHVAYAYHRSAGTGRLYLNGVEVASGSSIAAATQASGLVALDFSGYGSNTGFGVDGAFVSAKVYKQALSGSQVRATYDFERSSERGYGIR